MTTIAAPARRTAPDTLTLWNRYRATGDAAVRDRLVLTLSPLVRHIVYRKVREIPARCDADDFISCGLEALIHSIDRYDPSKGATLEQFAWTRIHGAVIDELRRNDWAPRSVRRWEREIDKAADAFTARHGRGPEHAELADALGITTEELRLRSDNVSAADVTSLNSVVAGDEETSVERIDTLPADDDGLDPAAAATTSDAKARFRAAFAQLSARDRTIAAMLYVQELTLAEVGEHLGVSESRVCQLHGRLRRALREALGADAELLRTVV